MLSENSFWTSDKGLSGSEGEEQDSEVEIELDIMARNFEYSINAGDDIESLESKPLLHTPTPRDRHYTVFLIFGFLGLASLLPWNFFITAKKYFDFKFRNTSLSSNQSYNDPDHATEYQVAFESYLSVVSNGCNFLFSAFTVMIVRAVKVKGRIISSSVVMLIIFTATTVMVRINTDSWQGSFLIFTLVMAAVMSGAQSVLTASVLGLSAIFPPIYSQSAMIGQAAGGTFSAVVSILTHATEGGAIFSAFIYFLIAITVTFLAIIAYVSLHFLKFSKHYMSPQGKALQTKDNDNNKEFSQGRGMFYWSIFKKIWVYCLGVTNVYLVTLSIFPSVCSLIKAQEQDGGMWNEYFSPIACFLLFNLGDFLGRIFTFVSKFPGNNRPVWLVMLTVLRIGFIPLLMLCNAQPRHHLPVYLESDFYPIFLILFMGLTNGYLGTLLMSFGPVHVDESEAEIAGIMLALAMTVGLAVGSFFSILFLKLL